jgi:hypothetical protein
LNKKAVVVKTQPLLFTSLQNSELEVQFHSSGRTRFNTDSAGNALLIVKLGLTR